MYVWRWWWWLRIISVGTKATNTSVPSDLSHSPSSPLFAVVCVSPFSCTSFVHDSVSFRALFSLFFILLFSFVMLLMRNSCAFLSPSKWNTRTKKINSFYGSVKQWNFHSSKPAYTIWYVWIINCFHLFFICFTSHFHSHTRRVGPSAKRLHCNVQSAVAKQKKRSIRAMSMERLMSCSLYSTIWKRLSVENADIKIL